MALINYNDYFDFDGYKVAIKDLSFANKEFGKTVTEMIGNIKTSSMGVKSELKDFADSFSKFNVNSKNAGATLAAMGAQSERVAQQFADQNAAMQGLLNVQDLSTRSINQLKAGAKSLETQYNALGGASADLQAKKAALAQEYKRVIDAVKLQETALKSSSKEIKFAADSYKGLQKELTDIGNKLKTMPNAIDPVTGKINQNNKEALALQARYLQLNTSLKTFDASLGNHQRNVGNYTAALEGVGGKIKEFGSSLLAVAGISLGAIGIEKFFESSVEEANKAEAANTRLANILSNIGRSDAFDRIKGKAEELTKTFKYLNQADVTEVFGKLITFGKLTENQITELVPVIIDFAAKSKLSLEEATGVITKAFEGNARGLKEYGINIKDGKDLTERFGLVMTGLKSRVEGAGLAFEKTFPGQLKVAREEMVETQKEIGETLIPIFSKLLRVASDSLKGLVSFAKGVRNAFNFGSVDAALLINNTEQITAGRKEAEDKQAQNLIDSFKKTKDGKDRTSAEIIIEINKADKFDQEQLLLAKVNGDTDRQKTYEEVVAGNNRAIDKLNALANPDGNKILGAGGSDSSKAEQKKALLEYEKQLKEKQKILKEDLDTEINLNQDKLDREEISEVQFAQFKYDASVRYNQKASALENAANSVGYKAKAEDLKAFNNVQLKANADFDKAIVKSSRDVEKSHLEAKQKSIEDAANLEIASIKDAEQYELANKRLTNEARVRLEIDYLDKIDEITIKSLQDRAAIELDTAKRVALLTQATQLRRGIGNRDAFGDNVSIPKAAAQDNIKDLLEREAKLKSLGVLTIEQEISIAKRVREIRQQVGEDTSADDQKIFDLQIKKADQFVEYLKNSAKAAGDVLGGAFTTVFDDLIDGFDKLRKGGELTFADIGKFGIDAGNAITENYKAGIEEQLTALDKQKQYELKLAGTNASAAAAIEAKYQRESVALKRKEAKADKENALFQIAINTAIAAVKALPNIFLSDLIIGFGAIEAALVIAKPLPQFAVGTKNAPEGFAIVDEKGPELIVDKHGRLREIGGSGPRTTYLHQGDQVKTASETKKILAGLESDKIMREIQLNGRLNGSLQAGKQAQEIYTMAKAMGGNGINEDVITRSFERAVKQIPKTDFSWDENGIRKSIVDKGRRTTLLNNYTIGK